MVLAAAAHHPGLRALRLSASMPSRQDRAHVLDRHHDGQIPQLLGRRRHHPHLMLPTKEGSNPLGWSHGRRQRDPLQVNGAEADDVSEDSVSASSRSRESARWGSAFGSRQGVHLVDDDCLVPIEGDRERRKSASRTVTPA